MSPVVLIVALVFGLVAAAYYARALQQTGPGPQWKAPMTLRHPRDLAVWFKSLSAQARRDYLLSLAYSCLFAGCIAILAYREGSRVVTVILAGMLLLGTAMKFARRVRMRV